MTAMLLINTGDGKGKTTAAVGQALRAHGRGLPVAFCQFMKQDTGAGEQQLLTGLLDGDFLAGGEGFYTSPSQYPKHRAAAEATLAWAMDRLQRPEPPFLLVCDEALYALGADLLERPEVEGLIDAAAARNTHLLLTGRGLPGWLQDRADLVTEMHLVKHPYDDGRRAEAGVEF